MHHQYKLASPVNFCDEAHELIDEVHTANGEKPSIDHIVRAAEVCNGLDAYYNEGRATGADHELYAGAKNLANKLALKYIIYPEFKEKEAELREIQSEQKTQ